jgi:hypothetical protein
VVVVVGVVELFVLLEVIVFVVCFDGVVEVPVGTLDGVIVVLEVAGSVFWFTGLKLLVPSERALVICLPEGVVEVEVALLPVVPLKELPEPVVPERPS